MKGLLVVMLVIMGVYAFESLASDRRERSNRKLALPDTPMISSSVVFNKYGNSVVLPLQGNVYPRGFYYVPLNIGQPAKPYFLDLDTGSDLTWLQCDAPCVRCTKAPHPLYKPSNNIVICEDPICTSLHPPGYKCPNPEQCDYEVEYADGGSSFGVLVKDAFHLNLTNGIPFSPLLAMGCGYDQLPGASYHPLDGVLGLGRGKSSIVTQLYEQGLVRNVFGHCLNGQGGGFLFLGDSFVDPSHLVWTPMSRDYNEHYSPGLAEFILGGKSTGIKNLLVAFDSGSSYTYLSFQPYQALISWMIRDLIGKPLKEAADDRTLPFCWRGRKPFKTVRDVRKYFRPIALSFGDVWRSKTQFEFLPESYLIISAKGNACLGILNGTEVGLQNFNIIGDISMQDKIVVYDNEKEVIGWGPSDCSRIPKSQSYVTL